MKVHLANSCKIAMCVHGKYPVIVSHCCRRLVSASAEASSWGYKLYLPTLFDVLLSKRHEYRMFPFFKVVKL